MCWTIIRLCLKLSLRRFSVNKGAVLKSMCIVGIFDFPISFLQQANSKFAVSITPFTHRLLIFSLTPELSEPSRTNDWSLYKHWASEMLVFSAAKMTAYWWGHHCCLNTGEENSSGLSTPLPPSYPRLISNIFKTIILFSWSRSPISTHPILLLYKRTLVGLRNVCIVKYRQVLVVLKESPRDLFLWRMAMIGL